MGVNLSHDFRREFSDKPHCLDVVYDSPDGLVYKWEEAAAAETEKEAMEIADILSGRDYQVNIWAVDENNWKQATEKMDGQVIFNMVEEELLGYKVLTNWEGNGRLVTGADLKGLKLCWDKARVRRILNRSGLPGPRYRIFTNSDNPKGINFPAIVKSACDHGSFSVTADSVVNNPDELVCQIDRIMRDIGGKVLAEEYVDGRELQVTVMGNRRLLIFPVKEIIFGNIFKNRPKILTYKAKWREGSEEFSDTNTIRCPARITGEQKRNIEAVVTKAYRLLGGRDLARFDIRLKGNVPVIIDYNANPDLNLCRVPARVLGLEYADFLERVVGVAWQRGKTGRRTYKSEPGIIEFAAV